MKLVQLLKYSDSKHNRHIAGSNEAEVNYLTFHYKRFKKVFSHLKKLRPDGKILDVGTTPFTFFLKENTKLEVYALDYNDLLKERTEQLSIDFKSADITEGDLPYNNDFFDIILFAEVFEHLHRDPVKILKSLYQKLKPGGYLILGTPNLASFVNRVKLLFNQPILDYPTWDEEVHGHDRIYVKKELLSYLKSAGYNLYKSTYSSCVDFENTGDESKRKMILKRIFEILSLPLRAFIPSLNGTIMIIAQKPA